MKTRASISLLLGVTLMGASLAGCGSGNQEPSSAQDKTSFKGGPMPPGYRDKLAERMAQSQQEAAEKIQKARESAGSGGSQPAAK